MSTREEASLGVQSYQQVLAQSESVNSGPELEMVKRVASRLATATGKAGADFDWQVSLIRSSQANAFCLPGGKIVVYTGILPITQNESALATVLGHEMAHATSRHGSQRVLEQNLAQTALTGVAMSLSDMDYDKQRAVMGALGAGINSACSCHLAANTSQKPMKLGCFIWRELVTIRGRVSAFGNEWKMPGVLNHPSFYPVIRRTVPAFSNWRRKCRKRWKNIASPRMPMRRPRCKPLALSYRFPSVTLQRRRRLLASLSC